MEKFKLGQRVIVSAKHTGEGEVLGVITGISHGNLFEPGNDGLIYYIVNDQRRGLYFVKEEHLSTPHKRGEGFK